MGEPPQVVETCNGVEHEYNASDDGSDVVHQNGDEGYVNLRACSKTWTVIDIVCVITIRHARINKRRSSFIFKS